MVMHDFNQSLDDQQLSELRNQEQAISSFPTDISWPELPLALYPSGQDLTFSQPNFHRNEQVQSGQPGQQTQLQNKTSNVVSSYPIDNESLHWPDLQHSPWPSDAKTLFSGHVAPLSISHSHGSPLTPPYSANGEEMEPVWETTDSHDPSANCATTLNLLSGNDAWKGRSTASGSFMAPLTPAELTSSDTVSNDQFANLFNMDPLFTNIEGLEHEFNFQPLTSNDRHPQNVPLQTTAQSHHEPAPEPWISSGVNQRSLSNPYMFPSMNGDDGANAMDAMDNTMAEKISDIPSQQLQLQALALPPTFFEGLDLDCDFNQSEQWPVSREEQRPGEKDRLLIEWKDKGLSYKEIRSRGQFEEAESTLRGRYRTLTKPKHLRVRKPEWKPRDVAILLEAVDCYLQPTPEARSLRDKRSSEMRNRAEKLPWKQVAEYMERRGCYRYGNSTVKKKYLQIIDRSAES